MSQQGWPTRHRVDTESACKPALSCTEQKQAAHVQLQPRPEACEPSRDVQQPLESAAARRGHDDHVQAAAGGCGGDQEFSCHAQEGEDFAPDHRQKPNHPGPNSSGPKLRGNHRVVLVGGELWWHGGVGVALRRAGGGLIYAKHRNFSSCNTCWSVKERECSTDQNSISLVSQKQRYSGLWDIGIGH